MAFSSEFYYVYSIFERIFLLIRHPFYNIQMLSLNSLQSLLQAYPDLTSISLLLIILYISLYILGRTFRKFKIFLRMAVLSAVVTCVIYILLNGMESAQAKFDNIKTHVRELAFLLIDKKHAQKSRR